MNASWIRSSCLLILGGVIAIGPGKTAATMAFQQTPFPGHRVSGVVTGEQTPTVMFYRGLECGVGAADFTANISVGDAFEVRNVPAGVYAACLPHAPNRPGQFGPLDFIVANEDVRVDLHFEESPRSNGESLVMRLVSRPGTKGIGTFPGLHAGKTVTGQVSSASSVAAPTRRPPLQGGGPPNEVPGLSSSAIIYLVPVDAGGAPMRAVKTMSTSLEPPSSGFFEIENVPPGQYNLFVTVPDGGSVIHGEIGTVSIGRTPISIEGFELGTLSILAHRGIAVSGRVARDGRPVSDGVALALEPAMDVAGIPAYQNVARSRPTVAPDGTFSFAQVPEGRYRLRAALAGQPAASIRILHNGKDITETGLDVGNTPQASLEIVIAD